MKRTIFALVMITVFASCEQGGTKTTDTTTKDSMAAMPRTQMAAAQPAIPCDQYPVDPLLISLTDANNMIQAYHNSIQLGKNPNQNVSFQLDANVLRCALIGATNISKLDIYLATGTDGKMTLVYVGAYDSTGADGKTYSVEQPVVKADGSQWVMDHSSPCPTCLKIGIHTPPNANQ